jgi:HEPN domain-containing protein
MPGNEQILATVREWVEKAESDWKTAILVSRAGKKGPADAACFHAQQCAEKYLKAYLAFQSVAFPKTHSIQRLISLTPADARPNVGVREQALLSEYAVGSRYPGWPDASLAEARQAVALARRVRRHVRSLLPRKALSRRNP